MRMRLKVLPLLESTNVKGESGFLNQIRIGIMVIGLERGIGWDVNEDIRNNLCLTRG
jgi:hypothetical protein